MRGASEPRASPAVLAWRRHLEFAPEEARALGLAAAGDRPLARLPEQIEFYRGLIGSLAGDPEGQAHAAVLAHRPVLLDRS